ncbi:MAG: hypothetical protein QG588_1730 [Candidatus Poribacteria bacterium]|nr:hypothetical protein [Candidatus Poribacteria bacterium]
MGTALIAVFTIGFISFIYLASDLTVVAQQRQPKSSKSSVKKSRIKHKSSKNKAHPITLK